MENSNQQKNSQTLSTISENPIQLSQTTSFIKSRRFSKSVVGFSIGLAVGLPIASLWAYIAFLIQGPRLELGVMLLVIPFLIIWFITSLWGIYIGYQLGKEKDYPEKRDVLKAQRRNKLIKSLFIYIFLLIILFFFWPFLLFFPLRF